MADDLPADAVVGYFPDIDAPRLHQVAAVGAFVIERVETQTQPIAEGYTPQLHSASSFPLSSANSTSGSVLPLSSPSSAFA